MIMDLEEILTILRTARGRLRPIIDHYAQTRGEWELEPYLDDPDISTTTIVHIWDELPFVDPRIVESLKRRLEAGTITEKDRFWVDAIIYNHG
jgi:hypothetical protein